jgi:hypothetical protein
MSEPARLDRAWVRRGLTQPAPWGATLTGAWLDAEVAFTREGGPTVNPVTQGFDYGPPETYLTTQAHVRFVGNGATTGPFPTPSEGGTPTNMRRLDIRFPRPVDAEDMPKKGDRVAYTLDTGVELNLFISNVHSPRNFSDHVKVESEWFE